MKRRAEARDLATLYAAVAAGSAVGAVCRALASLALQSPGAGFPWGTLFVNIAGSLAIGFYAALTEGSRRMSLVQQHFMMAGFCGGFTTFSAFSLESLQLLQEGQAIMAGVYIVLSVATWLAAVWLGYGMGRRRQPK